VRTDTVWFKGYLGYWRRWGGGTGDATGYWGTRGFCMVLKGTAGYYRDRGWGAAGYSGVLEGTSGPPKVKSFRIFLLSDMFLLWHI